MRSVARIKLGYYPLPQAEGARLRSLLEFPAEEMSVLDPCAGTGLALRQITEGAAVRRYGVELDAERARQAAETGISTIQGNVFSTVAKSESFSLLYLNPPYDSEIGSMGNKRMELLFLEHTYRWLVQGGVLVMVVPHRQLESCRQLLSAFFTSFRVLRMSDPESERFDQVVLLAIRRKISEAAYEENRRTLVEAIWTHPLPILTGDEAAYSVPPSPPAQMTYKGLPLDELEDLALGSLAWKKAASFLFPKEEVPLERPITPLHAGHVGILCTAGRLNGACGEGEARHIAHWRTVKYVTTFTEKVEGYTEIHRQERFSNEVVLVYETGVTRVLTDKKKEDKDAERASPARAA